MPTQTKSIVDPLGSPDWKVEEWQIKFLLSERLLHDVKKLVKSSNWYEDPVVAEIWTARLQICFTSIENFYKDFGLLPHVGDRLFDNDSGLIVTERSIDGNVRTITFTISI
ncbi:hypothetical protein [Spirosoma sp.]|uniref:hypothetical protein n=1 Tax=Spirosoma sp. TaxID=1899569 RepID=UPI003B3B7F7A